MLLVAYAFSVFRKKERNASHHLIASLVFVWIKTKVVEIILDPLHGADANLHHSQGRREE